MQRATSLGIDEQVSNFIFLTQRLQHLTTHTHMFVDFVKKKRFRLPDCPFEKNINHRRLRQTNIKTTRACCLLLLWLSGGERNKLVEYCMILCTVVYTVCCVYDIYSIIKRDPLLDCPSWRDPPPLSHISPSPPWFLRGIQYGYRSSRPCRLERSPAALPHASVVRRVCHLARLSWFYGTRVQYYRAGYSRLTTVVSYTAGTPLPVAALHSRFFVTVAQRQCSSRRIPYLVRHHTHFRQVKA